MRFKAFFTKQGYGPALDDLEDASEEMHLELYTSLVLALPEDDLLISRRRMRGIPSVAPSSSRLSIAIERALVFIDKRISRRALKNLSKILKLLPGSSIVYLRD